MNTILFLSLVIVPLSAQMIEITPINTENGYTIFKLDERPIVDSFTKILHIVNLTEYEELIDLIEYNAISLNISKDDDEYKLLQRELRQAKHSLKALIPQVYKNHRSKRGLINILGKGLKLLAGTMDNDDATDIHNQLQNLDYNTKNVINQINKQVIINNNLIKNVDEMHKHLNRQQQELTAYLSNITNQANTIIDSYNKNKYVFQLYTDITTLNKQLEKLTDIILLSKLNVLAHDILTDEEMDKYNITVEIIPYIRNSVMFTKELLIFTVCLPNFTKEKYFNAIIVPFPNDKFLQLDSDTVEIIIQNRDIYHNNEGVVLQKNLKLHNDSCIRNLFNENNICPFKYNNKTSIEKINDNMIITKNLATTELRQNCIDQELFIKNNNVIKFSNCKIGINGNIFKNKIMKFTNNVMIPNSHLNLTKKIKNLNLTLEHLHLNTINNREQIEYVDYKSNFVNSVSLGINFYYNSCNCNTNCSKMQDQTQNKPNNITNKELIDKTIQRKDTDPFAETANN